MACQNRCRCSLRHAGGRPGERIAERLVRAAIQPADRPITHPHVEVLRAPIESAIYTTNSVESLNYQLRKISKNRGPFPNDDAVIKLLWLAIRDIEDKRARERAKEAGLAKDQPRKAPPRPVEGAQVQHWNQALGALHIAFPGRLEVAL